MPTDIANVRADFDRIARLDTERWEIDDRYIDRLLRRIPGGCERALDIGCGSGRVTRRLAERSRDVLGIDASTEMLRVARERSADATNIRYQEIEFDHFSAEPHSLDAIVSVSTLHHLPMRESFARMREWLRPGGVLLIVDLGWPRGLRGVLRGAVALPLFVLVRLWHTRRLIETSEVRAAWKEHTEHDEYPSVEAVRAVAEEELPGAELEPHLFWRYSLTWHAPG